MQKNNVGLNGSQFKDNIDLFNFVYFIVSFFYIVTYWLDSNLLALFVVLIPLFCLYIYGRKVGSAFGYFSYLLFLFISIVFLNILYQVVYYFNFKSYGLFLFLMNVILIFLTLMDYISLRNKGVINKIFEGLGQSIESVVDVFGFENKYLSFSKYSIFRYKPSWFDGNIFFSIVTMPIVILCLILAPFSKSVPVVSGYLFNQNGGNYNFIVLTLTFTLNIIFLKNAYMFYSGYFYFSRCSKYNQ